MSTAFANKVRTVMGVTMIVAMLLLLASRVDDSGLALPLGTFLGGVFVMALLVSRRARSESQCGFCGQTRMQVRKLVEGPVVSICETCAPLAVEVIAEAEDDGWLRVTEALPQRCPWVMSSAAVEAIVAQHAKASTLRRVASIARRQTNSAAVERALTRIPEAERTDSDWISLGIAIGAQRRYEEAITVTRRAAGKALAPWVVNNVVSYSARATLAPDYRGSGSLSHDTAESWLRELDDACQSLRNESPGGWEHAHQSCLHTRAEVQCLKGDIDAALATLEQAAAAGPLSGVQHLCRARVFAAKGSKDAAVAELKLAIGKLHPESEDAHDARARLSELDAR
ncbi:hypothetical protein LZC95_48585 [Pendulispora brunnea]|uniref:ClpX-type ZB domain-containing protein n=1 Tax=Pendulispora brunnea TaxID=2905690 RepID=A0ABZ2K6I1_9BACT